MQHRTTMPRTARLFGIISLLTILTLLAVACGGGSDTASSSSSSDGGSLASTSGEPAANADAAEATATSAPAPTADADDAKPTDPTGAMTLAGAVTATLDDPAACGNGVMGYDYQVVNSTTDAEESFWMFQIYISNFEDTPGEYPVGADGYKRANVTLTDGAGTSWNSTADTPGSVVVASDQASGTITATLTSDGSAAPVEVHGAWTCDAD